MATNTLKKRFKRPGVYMVDFHPFAIPESIQLSRGAQAAIAEKLSFSEEATQQMGRFIFGEKCGVGDIAGVPPGMTKMPLDISFDAAMEEWEMIAFDVVDKLLTKLNLRPKEIDIVITTNTTLSTIPSLSARVCNRFKMRSDVQNFSLGGQGCTGGIAATDLAKQMLMAEPNRRALLVLNENLTAGFYEGEYKPFLMSNTVFRLGGAAVLLSNRKEDKKIAKYTLHHVVRAINTSDESEDCVKQRSDPEAPEKKGVQVNGKLLVPIASAALTDVLTRLGPLVLPLSEVMKVARNPKYKPNFSKGFEHVVIHPGAVKVIDGVRSALGFGDKAAIPSLQTLNRFGNTSSSSTFYILGNVESRVGIRKGDRVLQLAMGSGFKAAAAVWVARRTIREVHEAWQGYPKVFIPADKDPYAKKYSAPPGTKDLFDVETSRS